MSDFKYKLGFIGYGNMAKAIVKGVLNSGYLKESQIAVSRQSICNDLPFFCTNDNNFILNNCEYVVLAVKPQVFKQINLSVRPNCIISIMAGISSDYISNKLNTQNVIRVMPNTPSQIAKGVSVIAQNACNAQANDFCKNVFESIGSVYYQPEELFHAVTCVSGSGPAYAYYFAKAMIEAGVLNGLDYDTSKNLTIDTIIGACEMIKRNPQTDIDKLIENVCSKGGTTIQAVNCFRENSLEKIVEKGMTACKNRSIQLGEEK